MSSKQSTDHPSPEAVSAAADNADGFAGIMRLFDAAMKFKAVMLKKGLRIARCKCPLCGNETLYGRLLGPKNHLHAACRTTGCTARIME